MKLSAFRLLRMLAMDDGLRMHSATMSVMLSLSLVVWWAVVVVVVECLVDEEGLSVGDGKSEDDALLTMGPPELLTS